MVLSSDGSNGGVDGQSHESSCLLDSENEIASGTHARDKPSFPTDRVLESLLSFESGSIKKKRSRVPSDSSDKGHPSKQARSCPPKHGDGKQSTQVS